MVIVARTDLAKVPAEFWQIRRRYSGESSGEARIGWEGLGEVPGYGGSWGTMPDHDSAYSESLTNSEDLANGDPLVSIPARPSA